MKQKDILQCAQAEGKMEMAEEADVCLRPFPSELQALLFE